MLFQSDGSGQRVQVFTPENGKQLPTTYTPANNEVVKLGAAVDITLDTIVVSYSAGTVIGLTKDVEYTLSLATDVHYMV